MNRSQKIYNRALDKYNGGHIESAIKLCDKSISLNAKNRAAINLKGLLLYLKGDLWGSRKIWNMNYKSNNDIISKKYIDGSKDDEIRFRLYGRSLMLIKELRINEALKLLQRCAESDFNYIEVNNCSALCYIKKGEYQKALKKIDNVFKVDADNFKAKKNIKLLEDVDVVKKRFDIKRIIVIFLFVTCMILLLLVGIHRGIINFKNYSGNKKYEVKVRKDHNILKKDVFAREDVEKYIQAKDYDSMYFQFDKWKNKKLSAEDKRLLSTVHQILNGEGCLYFYNLGSKYLDNGDYDNAISYFKKSYEVGNKSDLDPHITYFLARSVDLSGDHSSALKYYSQYDKSFPQGNYEESVLYRLAVLYRGMNSDISKSYAKKLLDRYPGSIYNNSIIDSILHS